MSDEQLSVEEIYIIKSSWRTVKSGPEDLAVIFYNRLFYLDGKLRPLFKEDIQSQAKKFFQYLNFIVDNLEQWETIENDLITLGLKHAGFNVKPEHYLVGGDALIYTLQRILQNEWNSQLHGAWAKMYSKVVSTMLW